MRPLTRDMLDYAAQDTLYLLELRDRLKDELERAGRWHWAQEEFQLLEGTRWAAEDPGTGFMRMKGARDLNRRELAVLRELVPWRDQIASRSDKATFRVIGNEQLLAIAKAQPATKGELGRIKGVPRGVIERNGDDLLAAVARGMAVPDAELPRFPKAPRWDRDPDFDARASALKTVRDAVAQRLELDPGVLGARDRLDAVARKNPATMEALREVKELRRWQVEVMGEDFLRALEPHRKPSAKAAAPAADNESPYREG